ncbi:MAG: hypothetical protein IJK67_05490 [Bacilli bacterium]|nr:hypothetical protein [Bacilli bacterium]
MYKKVYAFYYWNYGYSKDKMHAIEYPSKCFTLPDNMSEKDAFLILSYLFRGVYLRVKYDNDDPEKIITTIKILDEILPEYGFKEPTDYAGYEEHPIVDLFIIDDKCKLFNNVCNKNRIVKWYNKHVSFGKILKIFKKLNLEYRDIDDLLQEKQQKQLKRIG